MKNVRLIIAVVLMSTAAVLIHSRFSNLWPKLPSSISTVVGSSQAATTAPSVDTWQFKPIDGVPAAYQEDERSMLGIFHGDIHETVESEWWLVYGEKTNAPFLLVGVAVDGQTIAVCDADTGSHCEYSPSAVGGASILSLNTEQVKLIQKGQTLELIFFINDEFVKTKRSLVGASNSITALLTEVPKKTEESVTAKEDIIIPPWEVYETKDKALGHVVIVHGPVKQGEVILSWSSVAFDKGLIKIDGYSGSEMYFKPTDGDIVTLEDVYWVHNGKRTNIEIAEMCKQKDKTACVFRGGVSIIMSTNDLLWMQIGHTFTLEWKDALGKSRQSQVVLGSKSYPFNTRIQELMTKDGGTIHPRNHTTT